MTPRPCAISPADLRQVDDLKDDRLLDGPAAGDIASLAVAEPDLDELDGLVDGVVSTGLVEVSQVLMCAKCIGECKVF